MNLAERFEELRAAAVEAGVDHLVGDVPDLPLAVRAYASVLGLDQGFALDPEIPLAELREVAAMWKESGR